MESKVMTMSEAVSKFLDDGDGIAISGFTTNREPYAAVHEIIRQNKKDLTIFGNCVGGAIDLLIGRKQVKVMLNSYSANSGFTNVSRRFRDAVEKGEIEFDDYSLDAMTMMFHGASLGVPYIPVKFMLGSDMVEKWGMSKEARKRHKNISDEKLIVTTNPFDESETVCLLPSPKIDVAFIHVQKAAPSGLSRIEGGLFLDLDLGIAAKKCIITCEEIVDEEYLLREPDKNTLPSFLVDAVVHEPYGAHPSQVYNYYDYDRKYLKEYDRVSKCEEDFDQFVEEWIIGTNNHREFIQKLGFERVKGLDVIKGIGYKPSFSSYSEEA